MAITYSTACNDINGLRSLLLSAGWDRQHQLSEKELASLLERSWRYVAAYDGDRLIGLGRIARDGVPLAYDMITDPAYRKRGVRREILWRLATLCVEHGLPDCSVRSGNRCSATSINCPWGEVLGDGHA